MSPVPLAHPAVASVAAVLAAIGLLAAGCGGAKTTTSTNAQGQTVVSCQISFAKTKFLLHTGVAAGAFYRYIYNPWRAGAFKKGAPGRKKALAKAAASGLVVVHELKIAARDAQCDGPALKALARPMARHRGRRRAHGPDRRRRPRLDRHCRCRVRRAEVGGCGRRSVDQAALTALSMDPGGLEPPTFWLPARRSPS